MMKKLFVLLLTLFIVTACGNNRRPGLPDKELFAQQHVDTLQQESKQEQDFSEKETYVAPPGIKYTENRSVDPENPPVVLDLTNRNLNIRMFNLSDYYSKVVFFRIKHPMPPTEGNFLFDVQTSSFAENGSMSSGWSTNSNFQLVKDSIIAGDVFFGYHSYDYEGNFLHTIASYDFPKVYDPSQNTLSYHVSEYRKAVEGSNSSSNSSKSSYSGYYVNDETRAKYVYIRRDTASNDFLFTFSLKGDTLCRFLNYNPKPDLNKKGLPISWDHPAHIYFYGQTLTIRQAMNDTVYRVTAPNRLVPAYVINFGPYKVDAELAADFSNKFLPDIWKETSRYVLFTYNKDRDTPNNRINGIVKFFYAYYDKQTRQFYHFCEETTIPEQQFLIENSVPNALPFMLSYAKIFEYSILVCYNKKRLETIIKAKGFASFAPDLQEKIKTLHSELDESEVIIMIINDFS